MPSDFTRSLRFVLFIPVLSLLLACNDSDDAPPTDQNPSKPAVKRCAP
ncbi:hypothetical protein [Acinetobacter pullicarnis]|nr:hypothetical protein [Acinetobacter pullicarnis]